MNLENLNKQELLETQGGDIIGSIVKEIGSYIGKKIDDIFSIKKIL